MNEIKNLFEDRLLPTILWLFKMHLIIPIIRASPQDNMTFPVHETYIIPQQLFLRENDIKYLLWTILVA